MKELKALRQWAEEEFSKGNAKKARKIILIAKNLRRRKRLVRHG